MPHAHIEALVHAFISHSQDFALIGPPGSGKTNLLRSAILQHRSCKPIYLSCTFLRNAHQFYQTSAMQLAISIGQTAKEVNNIETLTQLLQRYKGNLSIIIVLDNIQKFNFKIASAILQLKKRSKESSIPLTVILCGTQLVRKEMETSAPFRRIPVIYMELADNQELKDIVSDWVQLFEDTKKERLRGRKQFVSIFCLFFKEYLSNLCFLRKYCNILFSKCLLMEKYSSFHQLYHKSDSYLNKEMRHALQNETVRLDELGITKFKRKQPLFNCLFWMGAFICSRVSVQHDRVVFRDNKDRQKRKTKRTGPVKQVLKSTLYTPRVVAATECLHSCQSDYDKSYENYPIGHSLFFYSNLNHMEGDMVRRCVKKNDRVVVKGTKNAALQQMADLGIRMDQFLNLE